MASSDVLDASEDYRSAIVDLLGVLAYGELMASQRLASDAALAPTIEAQVPLSTMAAAA
ncbi:MAG: ferritin-like fold-containing protein, partial [Candidatus Nanopelagicales bacterium]